MFLYILVAPFANPIVKVIKMQVEIKMQIRNILICPDKLKGGLSSSSVASAIKEGLQDYIFNRDENNSIFSRSPKITAVEMADGGDGSAWLFRKLCQEKGERGGKVRDIECLVTGPLGNTIRASYILYEKPDGESVAFVECAVACGLALVPEERRNPLNTTTYGVGQLIRSAVESGASTVYIGVGGSSSNDCGLGMLQGLGFSVGLPEGVLACGRVLASAGRVEEPSDKSFMARLSRVKFIIINDVDNPLCGPQGAAMTYSPQKGADRKMAEMLDEEALRFLSRCGRTSLSKTGANEAALFPGAGTAGGMGFALIHFLGAGSIGGFRFFGEELQDIYSKIAEADLVITGEGKVDSQVLQGKVVGGCCKGLSAAGSSAMGKRLWLMCGKSEIAEEDLRKIAGNIDVSIFQMADIEPDMKVRMSNEHALMRRLAYLAAKELDGHL